MLIAGAVIFLIVLGIIGYVVTHIDGNPKALREAQQEADALRALVERIAELAAPQRVMDDPLADSILSQIEQYKKHPRETEGD